MRFLDLPLDLLSDILSHLVHPQHLAFACRVNKSFNQFAIQKLYERASIYSWHKRAKARVVALFNTLANYPRLARHVLKLEIRDFPKSVDREELKELVITGLKNCVNLRSCIWTRDGALNTDVLRVLQLCHTLAELEINGHSDGHYDARILTQFSHLSKISVIMPSAEVVAQLSPWMRSTGETLSSLTLICKMSPLVTDAVLEAIAPSLANLDQFSIAGCPRVTYIGISAILSKNTFGLQSLSLEALSPRFDLRGLSDLCAVNASLSRLKSFTLSIYTEKWLPSILALLAGTPLTQIQLYASSGDAFALNQGSETDNFWRALLDAHGPRLLRVSVHRMPLRLAVITDICARCPALRQLFVTIHPEALNQFAATLALARRLVSVHVNFQARSPALAPASASDDEGGEEDDDEEESIPSMVLKAPEALAIVRRCPESIALFGCNSRVWHVGREIHTNEQGERVVERFLERYEMSDIPEQFLVVRT